MIVEQTIICDQIILNINQFFKYTTLRIEIDEYYKYRHFIENLVLYEFLNENKDKLEHVQFRIITNISSSIKISDDLKHINKDILIEVMEILVDSGIEFYHIREICFRTIFYIIFYITLKKMLYKKSKTSQYITWKNV